MTGQKAFYEALGFTRLDLREGPTLRAFARILTHDGDPADRFATSIDNDAASQTATSEVSEKTYLTA